jgi:hypothetical protein
MSRPACLLWFVMLASATAAAPPPTNLTVGEFDRLLASLRQASDKSAASRLAGLRLTERASSAQLGRWEEEFTGSRTREALMALADASAFLRPPPSDIPAVAAPDEQMEKQIHERIVDYVKNTLPRLPNLVAQRTTTAFTITTEARLLALQQVSQILKPAEKKPGYRAYQLLGPAKASGLPDGELFWMGSFSQTVTYRDGVEVADSSAESIIKAGRLPIGLISSGEFGSILRVMLMDAEPEKIVWDHWERSATGPLADFRFTVPRKRSHFAVTVSLDDQPDFPAYKGEILVDPSSGAVLRISVSANIHVPESSYSTSIVVEFGPEQIGGKTYICPIRGVAMTKSFSAFADLDADSPPVSSHTSINDVSFTNYHVFRSNARVLSGTPDP